MRIITGSARGTRLKSVDGLDTRPTSDQVKESLFSIIQFDIEGRRVLELFAGTGQLALEALSRGAESAVMVDNSAAAVAVMRANAEATKLADKAVALQQDYKAYLQSAPKRRFQLVILDPPYREGYLKRIMSVLEAADVVSENGLVICEGLSSEAMPPLFGALELLKSYKYGRTGLFLYRRSAEAQ